MADALTGIVGKEDLGIPGSLLDDAHGDRWEHLLSFNPMARVVGGLDGILVSKVKYMFFTVYLCTPKDVDWYNMIIGYFGLQDPAYRNATSTGPRMMHFAVNMKAGVKHMVSKMWPNEHASRRSPSLGGVS